MTKDIEFENITGTVMARHRIMADSHLLFHGEEETYRPYNGTLPIPPDKTGYYLVHGTAKISDRIYDVRMRISEEKDKHPLLRCHPEVYIGDSWWRTWRGAVWQFGDETTNETMRIFKEVLKGQDKFEIKVTPGLIVDPVGISVNGLGYFKSEDDEVAIAKFSDPELNIPGPSR